MTGTLSGIMLAGGDKDARMKALDAANKAPTVSPAPTTPTPLDAPPSFGAPRPTFAPAPAAFAPAPMQSFTPQVVTGFGGKPAPAQEPQPEI